MIQFLMKLPSWILIRLSGKKQIEIRGRKLHPPFQFLLKLTENQIPNIENLSHEDLRSAFKEQSKLSSKIPSNIKWKDHQLKVSNGSIKIREYYSSSTTSGSALVYFHGGGFVIGNIETHHQVTSLLCNHLDSKIFSVEYRLSPENKYPIPLEDSCNAYEWVIKNSEYLEIKKNEVSVGGDSCGGNIAAHICLKRRKENRSAPKAQLLLYPWVNSNIESNSVEELKDGFSLTKPILEWFRFHYLNNISEASSPDVSPILNQDLSSLPPSVICTAGFDPLRDEGNEFAQKLIEAGNKVTIKEYPGFIHLFASMQFIPGVSLALYEICSLFKETTKD